jgi:hypothetical protein
MAIIPGGPAGNRAPGCSAAPFRAAGGQPPEKSSLARRRFRMELSPRDRPLAGPHAPLNLNGQTPQNLNSRSKTVKNNFLNLIPFFHFPMISEEFFHFCEYYLSFAQKNIYSTISFLILSKILFEFFSNKPFVRCFWN